MSSVSGWGGFSLFAIYVRGFGAKSIRVLDPIRSVLLLFILTFPFFLEESGSEVLPDTLTVLYLLLKSQSL